MIFGTIPAEPPRQGSLDACAPQFKFAVLALFGHLQALGFDPVSYESVRTAERQAWLYGFGRQYDDDRGIVTHAPAAEDEWHFYALADDVISKSRGWDHPTFFAALAATAPQYGLTSGASWHSPDLPHLQWGKCKPAPSDEARTLYASGGVSAVWTAVGAV